MNNKKYKFYLLSNSSRAINSDLQEMQLKGWEIAGEVSVKPHDNNRSSTVYIPMKLELK